MAEMKLSSRFNQVVDWEGIPVGNIVPAGAYLLRIDAWQEVENSSPLRVMGLFVIEDGPLRGQQFPLQSFYLGTEDDPLGNDPKTQASQFGWKRVNEILTKSGTPKHGTTFDRMYNSKDRLFRVFATVETIDDGREFNRIQGVYKESENVRIPGQPNRPPQAQGPQGNGNDYEMRSRQAAQRPSWDKPSEVQVNPPAGSDDIPF